MKHNYTDTQLQAAIDGACLETHREHWVKVGTNLVIDTDAMPSVYAAEASARLDLIKSALAALPEPKPPTVGGKTPGQFYTKRLTDSASAEIPWIEWHGGECPLRDEEVEEWEYKFRQYPNEVTEIARKASSTPNEMVWRHDGSPGDITAYRVLKWREGFGPVDEESMLLNLLAVIHRDGGHYRAEHGTRKAVEDAYKEWQRLISIAEKTEPKSSLSQLRPLAEAGPVPEGCVRVTGYKSQHSKTGWVVTDFTYHGVTHFTDIRLPDPAEANPYAELKAAHAAGKAIQFKPYGCPWEESDTPDFTAPIACYRIKPEPSTFEAHGKTWTRHKPGDPMPCDGEALVDTLWRMETPPCELCSAGHEGGLAEDWDWSAECQAEHQIIGWRYADEPTPEPIQIKPWTPAVGDVVTLKSGGPKMTIRAFDRDDPMEAWCHWFKDEKSCAETFPTVCLQPA